MSLTFEHSKSLLNTIDTTHNTSLYSHLTDILHTILSSNDPKSALSQFEQLSLQHIQNQSKLHTNPVSSYNNKHNIIINNDYVKQQLDLHKSLVQQSIAQDKYGISVYMSDQSNDYSILQSAGISVFHDITQQYILQLSIQSLLKQNDYKINNIRFWGKLIGKQSDYYIVEAKRIPAPPVIHNDNLHQQQPSISESSGNGVNQYIYYITNTYADASTWTLLPDLLPDHIITSRQLRTYLTGDLNSAIHGYKYNEAIYVRSLIARITHSCSVAPKGQYTTDTNDDDIEYITLDGGYEPADTMEFDSYVHSRPLLLQQGRVTKYVPPDPASDDESVQDEKQNELVDDEDELPLLSSIVDDTHPSIKQLWTIRNMSKPDLPHQTILVKSLLWPGAYTVVNGGSTINIYIGNGLKQLGRAYQPVQPDKLQNEYEPKSVDDIDDEAISLVEQVDPLPPPVVQHSDTEEKEQDDSEDD